MRLVNPFKKPAQAGEPMAASPEQAQEQRKQAAIQAYQATPEDADAVSEVLKKYELAKRAKQPYYKVWAQSMAYYVGQQYKMWDPAALKLVQNDDIPPWRERVQDNQIVEIVLTVVSKLSKNPHRTFVIPNNPLDPQMVEAAEAGTKVLRHLDRITKKKKKRLRVEFEKVIYGTSFTLPYWNPKKQTQVAIVDPMTGMARGHEAYAGDQDFEVCSVWEVFPEPVADWENVSWCIKAKWRTLSWITKTFPERGLLVTSEPKGDDAFGLSEENAVLPQGGSRDTNSRPDGARVIEYYEEACDDYPQGRWIITANKILLYQEEALPHPKGRFPVIPHFGIPVPGRLWGMGWAEQVLSLQDELNKTESQIIENKNLTARPKYQAARQANLDEDALDDEPGEVVEWDAVPGVPPPGPMLCPQLPAYVAELPNQIIDRMRNITGLHDVSHSVVPQGIKSGVAIDLLQGADDSRLSVTNDLAGESWRDLDEQMLESIEVRYDIPRLVRVLGGRDSQGEAFAFMGQDLAGNTGVAVDATEGVNDSLAAMRQRVMDYRAAGFFDLPVPLLVQLMRIMGESQIAEAVQQVADDAAQQTAAAQGLPQPGPPGQQALPPGEGAADAQPVTGEGLPESGAPAPPQMGPSGMAEGVPIASLSPAYQASRLGTPIAPAA